MTRKAPIAKPESEENDSEPEADVIPIGDRGKRRSEDFSQRAFDVVRRATEQHDDEDDE